MRFNSVSTNQFCWSHHALNASLNSVHYNPLLHERGLYENHGCYRDHTVPGDIRALPMSAFSAIQSACSGRFARVVYIDRCKVCTWVKSAEHYFHICVWPYGNIGKWKGKELGKHRYCLRRLINRSNLIMNALMDMARPRLRSQKESTSAWCTRTRSDKACSEERPTLDSR